MWVGQQAALLATGNACLGKSQLPPTEPAVAAAASHCLPGEQMRKL